MAVQLAVAPPLATEKVQAMQVRTVRIQGVQVHVQVEAGTRTAVMQATVAQMARVMQAVQVQMVRLVRVHARAMVRMQVVLRVEVQLQM